MTKIVGNKNVENFFQNLKRFPVIYLFIFNLFNVDNYTPFLTFGNKTSFPRRVTTTSNL